MPAADIISAGRTSGSVLVRKIATRALDHNRSEEALAFTQDLIQVGEDYAIFEYYMQLRFGKRRDDHCPPRPGTVPALLRAMTEGRQARWAFGALQLAARQSDDVSAEILAHRSTHWLTDVLCAQITDDDDALFQGLAKLLDEEETEEDGTSEALSHVDAEWAGHEDMLVQLVSLKRPSLTISLIDGIDRSPDRGETGTVPLSLDIDDVAWWLSWMRESVDEDWILCDRLGGLMAKALRDDDRAALIDRFNTRPTDRRILSTFVLRRFPELSLSSFTPSAVDWMIDELGNGRYSSWEPPLIASLATEDLIQERILPLLLGNPSDQLRANLEITLHRAGLRHRRRYLSDDGTPLA